MVKTCLMLKTKDKRKFLTYRESLPLLREYVNTFGAEVHLVRLVAKPKPEILDIKTLVLALCDATYNSNAKYIIIERVLPKPKAKKSKSVTKIQMLAKAEHIRKFILGQFLSGKTVVLSDLRKKYDGLANTTLCNHLSTVRSQLTERGYIVHKLGGGKYSLGTIL